MDRNHYDATLRQRMNFVTENDIEETIRKDREYNSSWKKRGGTNAFFMLARKWDRLEEQLHNLSERHPGASDYDIFEGLLRDTRREGLIDDIRDLRRYLLLVECELIGLPPREGYESPGVRMDYLKWSTQPSTWEPRAEVGPGTTGRAEHPSPFGFDPDVDTVPSDVEASNGN